MTKSTAISVMLWGLSFLLGLLCAATFAFSTFREKNQTSSPSNRLLLGSHPAPRRLLRLPVLLIGPVSPLLTAEADYLTESQESADSSQGKDFVEHCRIMAEFKCAILILLQVIYIFFKVIWTQLYRQNIG